MSKILTRDELQVGDNISIFFTPQEKILVSKVLQSDLQIEAIKNSLIYLKGEFSIKEI